MRGKEDDDSLEFFGWEDFDFEIEPDEPVYPLNVVCRLLHMQYWTVHEILEEGILKPKKVSKRKKLFSHEDVKKLKFIKYLIEDRGVNIRGIKVIFEMREESD